MSSNRRATSEARTSSLEKALDVCEALAGASRGLSVSELARQLNLPPPTTHRLLAALKRRGFVRQDEDTLRYSLTLKMLDLSFRLLGRSELRLHAYPVVREFVLRTGSRAFIAVRSSGEVTYLWPSGPDAVAMYTIYGREMPGHCAIYLSEAPATRRLTCLQLREAADVRQADRVVVRFDPAGADPAGAARPSQRLNCTCAPVFDYTGREVARVGLFAHGPAEGTFLTAGGSQAWELARAISVRLGHLPTVPLPVTAPLTVTA